MRFIVTAIGSFSSNCVIRCLKAQGHYVVGCDIYEYSWLYESHICDVFFQAPLALKENQYIDFLLTIAEKERLDFIIPLTDVEIDVINNYRKVFLDNNIGLFIQTEECLSVVRNKYNLFSQFNEDDNINVPKTILANNLQVENGIIFPLVAKPINGRSSEGLYYISSEQDLKPILNSHKEYILQEKIAGPIYTVDYIRDIHGNDYSIPREELLRTKNGAGTTVRIVHDDILESSVSYIGGKLQIIGCVNMEFIRRYDKYYLIDINPRFSAGLAFTVMTGYNMVISSINCFIGANILPPIKYKEQILIKRYVEDVLWTK